MNPTAVDYEKLARAYCLATTGREDDWEDEAIDEENDLVVATRETIADFIASSAGWREKSARRDLPCGGVYWAMVQAKRGDRRESLTVVDCGDFRLTYKV